MMSNEELREQIESLFSNDWNALARGYDIAESCMGGQFYTLKTVMDKHFPSMTYKCVDQHGGEGEGQEYWTVVEFQCEGAEQMVKFEGIYQSHYGVDYTGWQFVKPVQVMVTKYQND